MKQIRLAKESVANKLKQAQETMIAKDYFVYEKNLQNKLKVFINDINKKFSNLEYQKKYDIFLTFMEKNIKVPSRDFYDDVAEFLTNKTGKYFKVKESYEASGNIRNDYDYFNGKFRVLKIVYQDKEIFNSGYLKDFYPKSHPFSPISKPDILRLILPYEKAENIYKILKQDDYCKKSYFANAKAECDNRYSKVKEVAPDFDVNELTDFIINYINKNCQLEKQNLEIKKN